MRKLFPYAAVMAAALLVSCVKNEHRTPTPDVISFSAEDGVTPRALLTDRTLKTNGNRIHVMDVLTGFTGSASWMDGNIYMDDEIVYSGATVWGFDSGRTYPWTTDGVHQFYAWLSYDTAMSLTADSFFGTTLSEQFSPADRILAIPALEMNTETPQFDFLYAYTPSYVMPRTETGAVPLAMKHLFSAVSIILRNESQDDIIVRDVYINGLKNKKSVNLNFIETPAPVAQAASDGFINNGLFSALPAATRTLGNGETYDLLARQKNVSTGEYRLIWPQTASDIAPSDAEDYLTFPITVRYEYTADEEHQLHTAHLRFPVDATFEPGTRYAYTLLFTQKHVELKFTVNPWNYNLNEWSFDEQSISEVKELDFKDNEGYDKPSKTCRFVGGTPIKGTFSIVNPSGAIWSIEPLGDVEYFSISPNQGVIDSENSDYEFYVYPNLDPSLDRSTDKKLKFRFYVQFTDGSVHDANTEVNRDDWTVILPKN